MQTTMKLPTAEETKARLLSMEEEQSKRSQDLINSLKVFSKRVGANPEDKTDNLNPDDQGGKQSTQSQDQANRQDERQNQPDDAAQQQGDGDNENQDNQNQDDQNNEDQNDENQDGPTDNQDTENNDNENNEQQEEQNPIAMSDDSIVNIEINKITNILDTELSQLKEAIDIVKGMKKNIAENANVNSEQTAQAQAECESFRTYFGLPHFFDVLYTITEDDINDMPMLTYRMVYNQFINSIRIVLSDYKVYK